MEKTSQGLCHEREKRINDAIQLKVPDRVPIFPLTSFYAAKVVGMTLEEAFYDCDRWLAANKKVTLELDPDMSFSPGFAIFTSGAAYEAVDFKQIKWPGHGVSPHHTFQFVEGEYMKADEYDAFLYDPSDYALRIYAPRIYGTLAPLGMLPPASALLNGYAGVTICSVLAIPGIAEAFESLYKAGLESMKWAMATAAYDKEMAGLGYPPFAGAVALAPFDMISDNLRGMRGAMLDMYRQPDKLLAAQEKLFPMILGSAIGNAQRSGNPRVFIPLHRGADGFMSSQQFETFYWPFLKNLILALIDAGLTPCPFWEGCYDQRLEYLAELPKGKIFGIFDTSDIFRVKEVLGDTMCIVGNMPVSLLQTGTPEKVKDYAKKLIDVVGKDGGFIMSNRGVMDECDPELVKVWVDFTKEYGVYR
ncbi:MAG: hypothetical protein L6435_09620 [Anaerolineae bacterium]|nr:hypothetical protein [Anaerolineae bacterium]